MRADKIIVQPVITEKIYDMIEYENKLVFIVAKTANKPQIRKAVEELYEVEVINVNTAITPKGYKQAIVKLGPNDSAVTLASKLGLF